VRVDRDAHQVPYRSAENWKDEGEYLEDPGFLTADDEEIFRGGRYLSTVVNAPE
jgi:hypothetical protein